jgi:hypothetical protein
MISKTLISQTVADYRRDSVTEEMLHQLYQIMESLDRHDSTVLTRFMEKLSNCKNHELTFTPDGIIGQYETIRPATNRLRPSSAKEVDIGAELQDLNILSKFKQGQVVESIRSEK